VTTHRADIAHHGRLLLLAGLTVAMLGCASGTGSGADGTARPAPTATSPAAARPLAVAAISAGSHVWVSVAVATLWTSPSAPRPVDAPALAAPARIRSWLAAMSTTVRRGLTGRVETQALYGEPLTVTAVSGSWLRVVAPTQSTSRDRRGYPGWVPRRQVTAHAPTATAYVATVTRITAWLRTATGAGVLEIGLGTRLPVLSTTTTTARVATPTGSVLRIYRSAVVVRPARAAALAATAGGVVATAKRFLGVPYLWGGRSGFAVDCSGFTNLVFGLHGIRLPRDADDQSRVGTAVARAHIRAGDLTFYGPSAAPTHVALYVGASTLIQAPSAGRPVGYVSVSRMATPVRIRRVL
jgi:cell wall-associated NlpC family hydrolase